MIKEITFKYTGNSGVAKRSEKSDVEEFTQADLSLTPTPITKRLVSIGG
jgi:hypothetical protein